METRIMETRIKEVTTSMMRCFKDCRKRYFFEYVECLKPLETPKALELGTLYHRGIEMLLKGELLSNVGELLANEQREQCESKNVDYEALPVLISTCMVEEFDALSGWRNWALKNVEKKFEVSTGYAKRLKGKIDGVIEKDGKTFLVEHKTTSVYGEDYLHGLLWDEQSTNYLYAHNKMLEDGTIEGKSADGVFYVIVEKNTLKKFTATAIEDRKYNQKTGELYKNQHDHNETDEEFIVRVREWYKEKPRVHTHFVYRTPPDIAERVQDMNLIIKDMVACEREETFYRNPSACKIFRCPYSPKCLDNVPDTDVLFIKKTTKNEELAG